MHDDLSLLQIIREALESDGFKKEIDLDQIQFKNEVEVGLHSEDPARHARWTAKRITQSNVSYIELAPYSCSI